MARFLGAVLIVLFILPTISNAEEYIAFDVEEGKKLVVELQYCEDSQVNYEKAMEALKISYDESLLALETCTSLEVIGSEVTTVCEDEIKVLNEKVELFKTANDECQKTLVKYKKYKPWYRHWYFYSNAGWLLIFIL